MTTEENPLMGTGLDVLNDINEASLVGYRDSLLQQQRLTSNQSNGQNIDQSNIISSSKSSPCSWQLPILGNEFCHFILTNPLFLHPESTSDEQQHQSQSKTGRTKVFKKSFYKCEWDMCVRVFVSLEDLRTHVLDVHVYGIDSVDKENSGKMLVETLKANEQFIEQVNFIETIDQNKKVKDELLCHISHNYESTNIKSLKPSQRLLIVDSDSNEQLMNGMLFEDGTDLDEVSIDDFDSTDSEGEQLHQSEHQNLRPFRCWYCDDSFKNVNCLRKHFEAFHARETVEETDSDSDDQLFGEMDSDEESSEKTDLNHTDLDSKDGVGCDGTDSSETDADGEIEVINVNQQLQSMLQEEMHPNVQSSEETGYVEENLHPQQLEYQQQMLYESTNANSAINTYENEERNNPDRITSFGPSNQIETLCESKKYPKKFIYSFSQGNHNQSNTISAKLNVNLNQPNPPTHLSTPLSDCITLQQNPLQSQPFSTSLNQPSPNPTQSTPNELSPISLQLNVHLNQPNPPTCISTPILVCITLQSNPLPSKPSSFDCDDQDNNGKIEVINDNQQLEAVIVGDNGLIGSNINNHQQQQLYQEPIVHQVNELKESSNQLSLNCPECGKSYKNKNSLAVHSSCFHSKRLHPCEVSGCGMKFQSNSILMQHYLKETHNGVNFPCNQCKMIGKKKDLLLHLQTHHSIIIDYQQSMNCSNCGKSFKSKPLLYSHIQSLHPKHVYKCGVSGCGKSIKTIYSLYRHYRLMHKRVNFPCDQCKMLRKTEDSKFEHFRTYHQIEVHKTANQSLIPQQSQQPSVDNSHDSNKELLERIGANEINVNELKEHLVYSANQDLHSQLPTGRHQGFQVTKLDKIKTNQLVNCPKCDQSFKSKRSLYTHNQDVHPKQGYKCGVSWCGKRIKTRRTLVCHYRLVHKEVNFPCDQCKMLKNTKDLLLEHFRTNHQIELYQHVNKILDPYAVECLKCDKSFNNNQFLRMHILNVHPKQTYMCKVCRCGKEFKNKNILYRHCRLIHKKVNLSCNQYKLLRNRKGLLMDHLRTYHQIDCEVVQQVIEHHESLKSDNEPLGVSTSDSNSQLLKRTFQDEIDFDELEQLFTENYSGIKHSEDLTVSKLRSLLSKHRELRHQPNPQTHPSTPHSDCNTLPSNLPLPSSKFPSSSFESVSVSLEQFSSDKSNQFNAKLESALKHTNLTVNSSAIHSDPLEGQLNLYHLDQSIPNLDQYNITSLDPSILILVDSNSSRDLNYFDKINLDSIQTNTLFQFDQYSNTHSHSINSMESSLIKDYPK